MRFLMGSPLPRRTFLQSMGATVALPFLDAMVPAGRALRGKAAADRTRLVAIEMVHGAAGCNELGAKLNLWSPAAAGRQFDLAPTARGQINGGTKHRHIVLQGCFNQHAAHPAAGWVAPEAQMDLRNGGATLLALHAQRLGF